MFVHVAAMTGQKELILASWFSMEDPGYGADRQSFKLSVEILTPSIKGTKHFVMVFCTEIETLRQLSSVPALLLCSSRNEH